MSLNEFLKKENLSFYHEWEYDGKSAGAEFEIQIRKEKEKIRITIDEKFNSDKVVYLFGKKFESICLFDEEYDEKEIEDFIQDLEIRKMEFIIEKFNLKEEIYERQLKEGSY